MRQGLISLAFGSLIAVGTPVSAQVVTANVTGGTVQGVAADGLAVFKGIPFAAPPVGENRWRVPQPVEAWTGVKPTDRFAPACMQPPMFRQLRGADVGLSEDCLYLNVWTPAESASDKLPVMVWLHGGGFVAGATSHNITTGSELAELGVVVVSVAYRFGRFGFLAHQELSAESGQGSGNYAFLDQIVGLEWVQQNIAAFGGDPSNVTIFGQSAGGISVSILAASPAARGLFDRVISQSGGFFGPSRTLTPLAVAEAAGETFLETLGVNSIAEARALPAQAIAAAQQRQRLGFFFVADGHVLRGDQLVMYGQGRFNDTPVLIGTNSDEGTLDAEDGMTVARLEAMVRSEFGDHADRILAAYPHETDQEASQAAKNISRDLNFAWPTWTWARLQARHGEQKAFVYYFDHRPSASRQITDTGAGHGAELPFVFGPMGVSSRIPLPEDLAVSDLMGRYWTNFAKTGDPNGAGLPSWPAFDEDEQQVMVFDDDTGARRVPNREQLEAMDAYIAWRREQVAQR